MQPGGTFPWLRKRLVCSQIGHVINSVNKKRNRNKRRIARERGRERGREKKGEIRWESTEERNWPPPLATTTSLPSLLSLHFFVPFLRFSPLLIFFLCSRSLLLFPSFLPLPPPSTMCTQYALCMWANLRNFAYQIQRHVSLKSMRQLLPPFLFTPLNSSWCIWCKSRAFLARLNCCKHTIYIISHNIP